MARKRKQQHQKEGGFAFIIVVLAFFIILSGILGYLYYDADSKIEAANKATEAANQNFETAKKNTIEEKEKLQVYKMFLGMPDADRDLVNNSPNKEKEIRKEYDAIMAHTTTRIDAVTKVEAARIRVDAGPGVFEVKPSQALTWSFPQGGSLEPSPAPKNLVDRYVTALADREAANRLLVTQVNRVTQLTADLDQAKKAYEAEKAKLSEVVAKIPMDAKKHEDERYKQLETRLKEFDNFLKSYRINKGEMAQKDKDIGDLQEKVREVLTQVKDLNEQLAAKSAEKEDLFPFDSPKGNITKVDIRTNTVEIDLGSADNVKPGLTFNVMPIEVKEKGIASRTLTVRKGLSVETKVVPKGIIEVTAVLGPNVSQAIIKEQTNELRDPILKTDLLFNSAWRKGQPDHIVLVGVFDVDGDGTDDIKAVDRELNQMGIVVDGYFDLVERKWIRGGPTRSTNYVVEGEYPRITLNDALLQMKTDVSNAISGAKKQATDIGAKAVRARDFFPRIGYKAKFDLSDERINQAAAKYLKAPGEGDPKDPPK